MGSALPLLDWADGSRGTWGAIYPLLAVVPRGALPEEPALAELPADPVAAGETASPAMEPGDPRDEFSERPMDGSRRS